MLREPSRYTESISTAFPCCQCTSVSYLHSCTDNNGHGQTVEQGECIAGEVAFVCLLDVLADDVEKLEDRLS